LMHVIAGKAVAFKEALSPAFGSYCEQIVRNARALCDAVVENGYKAVSGGTDNHLFLLSLVGKDTTGKAAQISLDRAGITTNKNMVPFDPRKPMVTSGIRIGTPAVTTRGMREGEMEAIAGFIHRVLENPGDVEELDRIRDEAEQLCRKFPLYVSRWSDGD
jgi:glycine hydroxymethyltransferase